MNRAEREPPRAGLRERRSLEASGTPLSEVAVAGPRRLSDPFIQDTIIASLLTVASIVGLLENLQFDLPEGGTDARHRTLDTLGFSLALMQTVPLAWRRVAPVAVLTVSASAMFVYVALGYLPSFATFGFLLALYTVAAHRERRISIPAALASGGVVLAILSMSRLPVELDRIFADFVVVGAVWFIGDGLRVKRGQVRSLEDRATRLERDREAAALRAAAQERRVIARELHDVVANNVSVMVAQSAAAQRVFDADPEEGRTALSSIEGSGRDALAEMRRLLGLARTDDDRPGEGHPRQGLHDIESLVAEVRSAGLPVELVVEGEPRPLPPGLELSAFRIVQEALTNVMEHAGPARATVTIGFGASALDVTIADDGRRPVAGGADPVRTRYGHLGMRERVGFFDGHLRVGPRRGGGYEVVASLPLESDPA